MKGENAVYFYVKCVEAMIYVKDIEMFLDEVDEYFDINPIVMYNVLETFIRCNINNIDHFSKENIYEIVNHYKNRVDINMHDKINNILRLVNNSNSSKIKYFIKNQYDCRFLDNNITSKALRDLPEAFDNLRDMLVTDFNILVNHSSFFSDEEFEQMINTCVEGGMVYIGSINILINENPNLLRDEVFVSRVKEIVGRISFDNKKKKRIYKKFKKNFGI